MNQPLYFVSYSVVYVFDFIDAPFLAGFKKTISGQHSGTKVTLGLEANDKSAFGPGDHAYWAGHI